MIIISIDHVIKLKEEDKIADNDNGDNNNNSNNENNHGNYIYFSIISNNICSNLYLYRKVQNIINNNHGNKKCLLFLYNCVYYILCVSNNVSHKVL